MDILKIIEDHNLSIRRIPNKITSCFEDRHEQVGDEVVFRHDRKFVRRTTVPAHAGWYMVKPVNDTNSMVKWSYKTDNLAPTLEASIALYLKSIEE